MDLKEQHDQMLAERPDGAEHDTSTCIYCNPSDPEGGDMTATQYTEDEVKAAVEAAVAKALAPYQEEAALEAVAKAIEDATAPLTAKVTELQNAIDTATLRADTAEQELTDLKAVAAQEKADAEAAELAETRRAERKEAVKEFAFKDEWINERLDRWVAMSDDDFTALLDEFKAIKPVSAKKEETKNSELPKETVLTASEETTDKNALRRELSRAGLRGIDLRTV